MTQCGAEYEYLTVGNAGMKSSRFTSAMRCMLRYLGEGLMWMGVPFGMDAAVAAEITARARRRAMHTTGQGTGQGTGHTAGRASGRTPGLGSVREHPDQLSTRPLSSAERAEWAALVERLR